MASPAEDRPEWLSVFFGHAGEVRAVTKLAASQRSGLIPIHVSKESGSFFRADCSLMENCPRTAAFFKTTEYAELTMILHHYLSHILLNQGQEASLGQKATCL